MVELIVLAVLGMVALAGILNYETEEEIKRKNAKKYY